MDKAFDPGDLRASRTATAGWELQNMLTVCSLIARRRLQPSTESRGAHYRLDYPVKDDAHWRIHLLWRRPLETPTPKPVGDAAPQGT